MDSTKERGTGMNIRVFQTEGIDELYTGVKKFIYSNYTYFIYTDVSTFQLRASDVNFIQVWEDET